MEQTKRKAVSITTVVLYCAFSIVTFAHLAIFIQYPFSSEISVFTSLGEKLKAILPALLLITLLPAVYKRLDKRISTNAINLIGLTFITLCLIYQVANVPGQAWSTVAFSGLLILLLFNNIIVRHTMSRTVALTFSFMVVWIGWVTFELIFQTGLLFYHPEAFGNDNANYYVTINKLTQWMFPAILYMIYVIYRTKVAVVPKLRTGNHKYFIMLAGVGAVATGIWFSSGMLIPIPVDANGVPYLMEINYWTREHLEFSVSRLSQISMMSLFATLFFKERAR